MRKKTYLSRFGEHRHPSVTSGDVGGLWMWPVTATSSEKLKERPHKGSDMKFWAKCTHKTESIFKNGCNQLKAGSLSILWSLNVYRCSLRRVSNCSRTNPFLECLDKFLSSSQQLQMYENGIGPQHRKTDQISGQNLSA